MIINITDLNYQDKILINETLNYSKDYLKDSGILKLDNVKVNGSITKDYENNNLIKLEVAGEMIILDAITSLEVPYEFEIEIEENLENSLKTLDLIEFLWHYIVLEIPIRYTKSDTSLLKNKYGDIYHEEEIHEVNNPFKDFFKE